MNQLERLMLEYRPSLDIKRRVRAILENVGADSEAIKSLPAGLVEATNLLGADVLDNYNEAEAQLTALIGKVSQCFDGRVVNGTTLNEYLNARSQGDAVKMAQFEDYHNDIITATAAGEAIPYILDTYADLMHHKAYINEVFYGNKAQFDNTDAHRNEELTNVRKIITAELASPGSTNYQDTVVKYHLLQAANDRIDNVKNFVAGVATVLDHDYSAHLKDPVKVVSDLTTGGADNLEHLKKITELRFKQMAFLSKDNKSRMRRLNTQNVRDHLKDMMGTLSDLKGKTSPELVKWFSSIDTKRDTSPTAKVLWDATDGLELLEKEFDSRLLDLHKANKMEEMQQSDVINSLLQKKETRQIHKLADALVKQFDFTNASGTQAKQFVESNGLNKPGSYCE